jgi:hypothetical protein
MTLQKQMGGPCQEIEHSLQSVEIIVQEVKNYNSLEQPTIFQAFS